MSTAPADVGLLFSWESWWAQSQPAQPSAGLDHLTETRRWYGGLWDAGAAVDFVAPGADLTAYRVVVLPTVYLLADDAVAALEAYAAGGGTLVVGCWSGLVDGQDRVRLGGYPGALRGLLGVTVTEPVPLAAPVTVRLGGSEHAVDTWAERVVAGGGTEVLGRYAGGDLDGQPAVTRHGRVLYAASPLPPAGVAAVLAAAGVAPAGLPVGVEAVRRGPALFLLNHGDEPVEVGGVRVGARDCVVTRGNLLTSV
jgi:beta-galactosidase